MAKILVILIGGALGALSRYELGAIIVSRWSHPFPLHTFVINCIGAFLLGFCNVLIVQKLDVSILWWLGIGVGFLGAFTTFSTFSFEAVTLMAEGNIWNGALYTVASVVVGFAGVTAGIFLGRFLFSIN